jgi:hypothetical protein
MMVFIETESEMFGNNGWIEAISEEKRARKFDDDWLRDRVAFLEKQVKALEEYLDIEYKTYSQSSPPSASE